MPANCFIENHPSIFSHAFPHLKRQDNKYTRGSCIVWSGDQLMTGASRLAASAALRIGAGLVTIIGKREALLVHAAHITSIMTKEINSIEEFSILLQDKRIINIIIGPGAGVNEYTRQAVICALSSNISVVIDADALTSFENDPEVLFDACRKRKAPVIFTPHEGEFGRLFHRLSEKNREEKIKKATEISGAFIILKGAESLIASPDGRSGIINRHAPPTLAKAGSGDVLTGILGGLLTQGMPAFEAAAAATWIHGEAAFNAGKRPIAEDLVEALRDVDYSSGNLSSSLS